MRLALVAILAIGCVEQGPGPAPKKIDPSYVQDHLLPAAPANITKFDVAVGDGIAIYLGNKLDRPTIAPGQAVTITHYWKVLRSPGPQWKVFTLVRGPGGTADFMNLPSTDMQIAHGPATWEPGEIIEDVQTLTLRPDWRAKDATVLVGLIEQGKHGTLDRMNVLGANTSGPTKTRDNTIIAAVLDVDLSRAPPPKGTIHITRAQGPISIDGAANEAGWLGLPHAEFVTAQGGQEPTGKAIARLTWDDQYLYLFATITDTDIVSPFKQQDDPLWKGDCVEIFIDADGNRSGYVELQANPISVTFDKWFQTTRGQPGEDEAWDSGMVAVAKLRGGVDPGDSGDQGWDVEIGIPWAAVKGKNPAMKVELPPRVGDRWRLNVVRVDRWTGGKPTEVRASSWNQITMSDFHALDRMLIAVFADPTGAIVAQKAPPAQRATNDGLTPVTLITEAEPVTVELLDKGGQKLDGKDVADGDLLATLVQREPKTQLVVSAQSNVVHARVATLLERAKQAGFTTVALLTQIDLDLAEQNPMPATQDIPHGLAMPAGAIELAATAGGIRVADKVLNDADLDRVLAAFAARDKTRRVIVRPDGPARYARVLAALELARIAGFTNLAIGTPPTVVPAAATATLAQAKDSIELFVDNAKVSVGGAVLDDAQLDAFLRGANKQLAIVLVADGSVSHARVVAVMELAKAAGHTKLAIKTQKAPGPAMALDPATEPAKTLELVLAVDGAITSGGKPVKDDDLAALFKDAFTRDKQTQVIIKADRGVPHGRVIVVMERAKAAGLTRLAIATK